MTYCDRLHFNEKDHILLSWRLREWRRLIFLPICQIRGVKSSYEEVFGTSYSKIPWRECDVSTDPLQHVLVFLIVPRCKPRRKSVYFLEGACICLIIWIFRFNNFPDSVYQLRMANNYIKPPSQVEGTQTVYFREKIEIALSQRG